MFGCDYSFDAELSEKPLVAIGTDIVSMVSNVYRQLRQRWWTKRDLTLM